MTQQIPPKLGSKVRTRQFSWLSLVEQAWGSEFTAPDPRSYEFSCGVNKDSTDRGITGLYGIPGDTLLVLDGQPYPDMRDGVFAGVGADPRAVDGGKGAYQEISADQPTI